MSRQQAPKADPSRKPGGGVCLGGPREPAWPSGTHDLSDAEFIAAMDRLTLPKDDFRHYDHIRLAWILLRQSDGGDGMNVDAASDRMALSIQRFAHQHGARGKYHDTITRAYMRFVAAHVRLTPHADDFGEFAAANPQLFDRTLPLIYYSESLLMSVAARAAWVEPDLKPLPAITDRSGA